MPIYTDYTKAHTYWESHKKYREFRGSPKMQKIYDQKFRELIKQKTVIQTSYDNLIWINPSHLVPKSNGDMRLVVDTTGVNKFMQHIHFKMEGVPTLLELFQKGDYAVSYDLKEAYNHVPVHKSMQPLLGIAWHGKCYQYVGMPFGLNDAPRVFSRIMRHAVTKIREIWNIRSVVYLDDLILLHQDKNYLAKVANEVTLFLRWLGWTINIEKSNLIPSQTWKYLGWEWDSTNLSIHLTKERRLKALATLRETRKSVYKRKKVTTRSLAKIIGQLSASRLQFPLASLYLVRLNHLKTEAVKKVGWNGKTFLDYSIMNELRKWSAWVKENKPLVLQKPTMATASITTDAAPSGWGASLNFFSSPTLPSSSSNIYSPSHSCSKRTNTNSSNNKTQRFSEINSDWFPERNSFNPYCYKQKSNNSKSDTSDPFYIFGEWSRHMSTQSSNKRELVAVHKAIWAFYPKLLEQNCRSIEIFSDNSAAVYNINRKAAHRNLATSLRRLLLYVESLHISIHASHIPGEINRTADKLSRLETSGDYSIDPVVLDKALQKVRFSPDVDLFASKQNKHLHYYCSIRPPKDPHIHGYLGNALRISWQHFTPLIHPPIPLIQRVLNKFVNDGGSIGALIAPKWKGQAWSPLLNSLTIRTVTLGNTESVLRPGPRMKKKGLSLPPGDMCLYLIHAKHKYTNQNSRQTQYSTENQSILSSRSSSSLNSWNSRSSASQSSF
jgi:hypothetical protein